MLPFYPAYEIAPSERKINYSDKLLFIGSCFSDEISTRLKTIGLNISANPLGVIFHPMVICRFLQETIAAEKSNERILQREDVFLSWDANSSVHAYSETDLRFKLLAIRNEWCEYLQSADFLFITFGSAWEYSLNGSDLVVANCHKMPGGMFTKKLTESDVIVKGWKEAITALHAINPHLQIVFTVSPVRHLKDGWIENNQSKAILIDAIRKINKHAGCSYFPAYEIVIDQLRDYRFFKEDRIHPNNEAVNFVLEKFYSTYLDDACQTYILEVDNYLKLMNHRALFHESKASKDLKDKTEQLKKDLLDKYPSIQL